ncbi:MAG: hypothetical protein GX878_04395 [Firmicutes bacterium]|nr:hypothetical protein [Bacillota bacterium]
MAEFYTWPDAARLLLTLFIALAVLLQTLAVVLSFYRHPGKRSRFFENLLELSVLLQILACSLLHGQVVQSLSITFIAPTGYGALRIALFAAVLPVAAAVLAMTKKPWPLLIVLASALTLPLMESAFGNTFAYLFLAALIFYLVRSIYICFLRYREINRNLSALSIKYMIDSLHTGLLFSESDGFTVLANEQMQRLMQRISGRVRRNANQFYELLASGNTKEDCKKAEFEGQIVCLLPEGEAWMFTKTGLEIRGGSYIQLTATDITKRWALTAQLQRQEEELKKKGEELSQAIATLHILSRERVTQRAKMQAHDVLGQRLTLLLRTIRSEQAPDYDLLRSLSQGLLEDLRGGEKRPSPQDELESLRQVFGSIGVDIELDGELPADHTRGCLFTDIIRKSVTNAVHHGFATKICVRIELSGGRYHLKVTNNGHPSLQPIVEGGGMEGIRKALEPYGGVIDVTAYPRFALTVDLPGGEADVQGADHR